MAAGRAGGLAREAGTRVGAGEGPGDDRDVALEKDAGDADLPVGDRPEGRGPPRDDGIAAGHVGIGGRLDGRVARVKRAHGLGVVRVHRGDDGLERGDLQVAHRRAWAARGAASCRPGPRSRPAWCRPGAGEAAGARAAGSAPPQAIGRRRDRRRGRNRREWTWRAWQIPCCGALSSKPPRSASERMTSVSPVRGPPATAFPPLSGGRDQVSSSWSSASSSLVGQRLAARGRPLAREHAVERPAVDAEHLGGARLVAAGARRARGRCSAARAPASVGQSSAREPSAAAAPACVRRRCVTSGGRSVAVTTPSRARSIARSMMCDSSRTLPGKS